QGLGLVGQAKDGGPGSVLGEPAQGGGALVEGGEAPALVDAGLGDGPDAHRDRGDDAEGPLGAEDELAQVGSRGGARCAAGVQDALGGGEGEGEDHLVEAAVSGGGLSAGAGGGEAADGGPLEGLGEVAEGEAVL